MFANVLFQSWEMRTICSLFLLLTFFSPSEGFSRDGSPEVMRVSGGRLFAQKIRVDRPDLKIEGELVLKRLQPLAGGLHLKKAQGDLRPFLMGIVEQFSGQKNLLSGFLDPLDLKDLNLEDFSLTVTEQGYELSLASATLPEGRWEKLTGRLDKKGHWTFASGAFQLSKMPTYGKQTIESIPVRYGRLQASGHSNVDFSLLLEKVHLARLPPISDPTGFWGKVLTAMGFAQGVKTAPLFFDRFETKVVADKQKVATQSLSLHASGASLSGKVYMPWKPKPIKMHLDLAVTSKGRPVKYFKSVVPWGSKEDSR